MSNFENKIRGNSDNKKEIEVIHRPFMHIGENCYSIKGCQSSTRGIGEVNYYPIKKILRADEKNFEGEDKYFEDSVKTETFNSTDIDFESCKKHLQIHEKDSDVAGSQFNSEIFPSTEKLMEFINKALPYQGLRYDQHDRCELTLNIKDSLKNKEVLVGWTGVKSINDLKNHQPELKLRIVKDAQEGEEQGIKGAWYPEMRYNPAIKQMETIKDDQGNIWNEKGKFEPLAQTIEMSKNDFEKTGKTNKITIIIQKINGKPTALTMFPGDNAPAFPVLIQSKVMSENGKVEHKQIANTLQNSNEASYWEKNVFIKVNPNLVDKITEIELPFDEEKLLKGLKNGLEDRNTGSYVADDYGEDYFDDADNMDDVIYDVKELITELKNGQIDEREFIDKLSMIEIQWDDSPRGVSDFRPFSLPSDVAELLDISKESDLDQYLKEENQ